MNQKQMKKLQMHKDGIKMDELVSVIMPSYNTALYIKETIQSVLNQTYKNWELFIVDDCSTDDTDHVVQQFLDDKRIHYLKNEVNSGAAISRNRALREAKGRWIAFLDSDDLWMPDKLEKQICFMEKNNFHFSYTEYEEMDEYGKTLDIRVSGPKRITEIGMYAYCWPGCLTVMYEWNEVGDIQISDIKKNNDYAIWLKVCKKADCYLYPKVLAKYRKRTGSISNHGYLELIKWHYRLFRESEQMNHVKSILMTVQNLMCGVYKKIRYVKKI